ncbi:MAG: adenylate/guanylate cyclase domain-containing protein, partial [Alphaproteobacteria bacterium]|nr:adenylate/guanylate cyclase domain-containing protein [Alphaproteobacteria bacterium]
LSGRGGEAGRKSGKRPAKARGGGLDLELSPQAKLGLGLLASAAIAAGAAYGAIALLGIDRKAGLGVFALLAVLLVLASVFRILGATDRQELFFSLMPFRREPGRPPPFAPKPFAPTEIKPQPPEPEPVAEIVEEDEPELGDDVIQPGGIGHEVVVTVLRFFEEALTYVVSTAKIAAGNLDGNVRFGCHLFLAGATDGAVAVRRLPQPVVPKAIAECVKVFATKPEQAKKFAGNYDEYLLDARCRKMFMAGREAINLYEDRKEKPGPLLARAIDEWKSHGKGGEEGVVGVMFTDMVGSTEFTQTYGDSESQRLVHAHNEIVRRALAAHDGREIKHTGDGIMASFVRPASAARAAADIQSAVAAHNQVRPDLPLTLRVGVSAGRPIQENEDLFGSTVQLAARLCAKAGDSQILVNRAVAEALAAEGGGPELIDRGTATLKGFKEPVPILEVKWK